ncbi:hypothetical protein ASO78B_011 [Escherichia phage vB_EcoS_ASO78B]|nr:hypothetical protein ASO78B_011 [Escherichia phage vB_EcoS_ASO78B]
MKLIDLLVKELPKRGGWPHNALSITQDDDGSLCVWDTNNPHYDGFSWKHHTGNSLVHYWHGIEDIPLSCDHRESIVTYWQYKAALAASQKPTWNGEGVPQVGCECEYSLNAGKTWWKCKIDYIVGTQGVVMLCDTFEGVQYVKFSSYGGTLKFRPIRTEADKKRERICDAIYGALTKAERQHNRSDEAEAVYDAIAAGKIPGVKLDD